MPLGDKLVELLKTQIDRGSKLLQSRQPTGKVFGFEPGDWDEYHSWENVTQLYVADTFGKASSKRKF
jgi:hypothetical protein